MALHLARGRTAEQQARRYLEQRGLRLLQSNYRCKLGEIDLVMQDAEALVFVEVRYRKSCAFGEAVETVGRQKQRRLLSTAAYYLQRHPGSGGCRFDVVGITGDKQVRIEWIKDAFQAHEA